MLTLNVNILVGKEKPTVISVERHREVEKDKIDIHKALEESGFDKDSAININVNCSYFNDGELKIKISNASPDQKEFIKLLLERNFKKKIRITQ